MAQSILPNFVQIVFEDRPLFRVSMGRSNDIMDIELNANQLLNLAQQAIRAHAQLAGGLND